MSARADDGQFKKNITYVVMNNKLKFCEVSTWCCTWCMQIWLLCAAGLVFLVITRLRDFLNWSIV